MYCTFGMATAELEHEHIDLARKVCSVWKKYRFNSIKVGEVCVKMGTLYVVSSFGITIHIVHIYFSSRDVLHDVAEMCMYSRRQYKVSVTYRLPTVPYF